MAGYLSSLDEKASFYIQRFSSREVCQKGEGGGVHWVMEGGFLVPKTAGGESFKEILGQQKCQGWKLPSHEMEMSACCQFEHL